MLMFLGYLNNNLVIFMCNKVNTFFKRSLYFGLICASSDHS